LRKPNQKISILTSKKYMKKIIFSIISVTTLILSSCGDEHSFLTNVTPADGARVKFIHAAPDAPGVAIFVNDKKISGVLTVAPATPTTITYGGVFPSNDYAVLPAGTAKVKVTTPSLSDAVLLQGDAPLESGKYYSVFATGLAPTYSPVVVLDDLPAPTGNNVFIRLINLIPNSKDAEISINGATLISSVAAGKGGEKFTTFELPAYTGGQASFAVAYKVNGTSTTTTAGSVSTTAATISYTGYTPSRVLTIVLRGLLSTQVITDGKPVITASKFAPASTSYLNR
jgi:Domain of unknown function (DUF4397)